MPGEEKGNVTPNAAPKAPVTPAAPKAPAEPKGKVMVTRNKVTVFRTQEEADSLVKESREERFPWRIGK